MNVFVGQIYVQPGITFPFSHKFQKWLGAEITKQVKPSKSFLNSYSKDFDVIFRLSAKAEINEAEIKGPTVFKKDRDVEFTIFLPHPGKLLLKEDDYKTSLQIFLDCIVVVFESLGIDTTTIKENALSIIHQVLSDNSMFKKRRT